MTALESAVSRIGEGWVSGTPTAYGRRAGYPTLPWDGAFVDVVLFDSGLRGAPSFINPHMAFAAMTARGEMSRHPMRGDVILTSLGTVALLESYSKRGGVTVIAGDTPIKGRPGTTSVQRLALTPQDILLHGTPKGFLDSGTAGHPSPAQIRSNPEHYLRGALQAHPYTKGLGPVSMSSALYRWALLCGARPADADARLFRDEYIMRLGAESGYFSKALR